MGWGEVEGVEPGRRGGGRDGAGGGERGRRWQGGEEGGGVYPRGGRNWVRVLWRETFDQNLTRALVKAYFFEASKCLCNLCFEASELVSTKTSFS